jgi:hypothetical protein
MAPLKEAQQATSDKINIIFGVIAAILALLAVYFGAASWKLQKRFNDRLGMQHVNITQ